MADIARVAATQHQRQLVLILTRHIQAAKPHTPTQKAVNYLGKQGQLVHQQNMYLRALILIHILFMLAMAQIDFRAVPKLKNAFGIIKLAMAAHHQRRQHRPQAARPLQMVFAQIVRHPPKNINLQAGHRHAQHNRHHPHQMAFAASRRTAI